MSSKAVKHKLYVCLQCDKKFNRYGNLWQHVQQVHEKPERACKDCGYIVRSKMAYYRHRQKEHGASAPIRKRKERPTEQLQCEKCSFKTLHKGFLARHMNNHKKNDVVSQCSDCDKAFDNALSLRRHVHVCHRRQKYQCDECTYSAYSHTKLHAHRDKVHFGIVVEKMFQCDRCERVFASTRTRLEHIRAIHYREERYKCPQCDAAYRYACSLVYHKKCAHSNDTERQLYKRRRTDVPRTRRDREERVTFVCIKCSTPFSSFRIFSAHMLDAHDIDKPFDCGWCDFTAKTQAAVTKHRQKNHCDVNGVDFKF